MLFKLEEAALKQQYQDYEQKFITLIGDISPTDIEKINESQPFRDFVTHITKAALEVGVTLRRREDWINLKQDEYLHGIVSWIDENHSFCWNNHTFLTSNEAAKYAIGTLIEISHFNATNYKKIEDNKYKTPSIVLLK